MRTWVEERFHQDFYRASITKTSPWPGLMALLSRMAEDDPIEVNRIKLIMLRVGFDPYFHSKVH